MGSELYAAAGVDPTKITPFKKAMLKVAALTQDLPLPFDVRVRRKDHGGAACYVGPHTPVIPVMTVEGLGNANWVAQWMADNGLDPDYELTAWAMESNLQMAIGDNLAHGARPAMYMDEVAAGDSDWFTNEARAQAIATGVLRACQKAHVALAGGESPSLKWLVNARPPVQSAPVLSGAVLGFIAPTSREVPGRSSLCPGLDIVAFASSGIHANGYSTVLKVVMETDRLPSRFGTSIGNSTLGRELLAPTACYVEPVMALLDAQIPVVAFLPGTGDGVAKLAIHDDPTLQYVVEEWPALDDLPIIFDYLTSPMGLSIDWLDCLLTFNCGAGYYAFLEPQYTEQALRIIGDYCRAWRVGRTQGGPRGVLWQPPGYKKLELSPPT